MFLESLFKLQECDFVSYFIFHPNLANEESLQFFEFTWILSSVVAEYLEMSTKVLPSLQ